MNKLVKEEICYIAGFIDGEGCMSIMKRFHSSREWKWIGYSIRLSIGNTNLEVLEYLRLKCGVGSVYKKVKGKGRKQAWEYSIFGEEAQELVRLIFPYFIVKRNIAELFLKFPFGGRGIKHHKVEIKEGLYIQAKKENLRGELEKVQRLPEDGKPFLITGTSSRIDSDYQSLYEIVQAR